MYYNRFSRRYFLQGAGAALMLPFLPSIMNRAYAAGSSNLRYIQFISSFGQYGPQFYPSDQGLTAQTDGIMARPLSGISGDISRVFGPSFNNYKNRMTLVRGLHVLAGSDLHNGCMPTCSSGTPEDQEAYGRPVFSYSIDAVLSGSSKIYQDATGKQRHVNFCPVARSYQNFSWNVINGSKQHMPNTTATSALLAKFSTIGNQTSPQDPSQIRKQDVIQGVYNDYKSIRDSGKLSMEDKQKFESYIALVDEIQKGLAGPGQSCQKPMQEADNSEDAQHRNQARILVAAMACQLTNVASYVLSTPYDPIHGYSHDNAQTQHADIQRNFGTKVTYVMSLMDQIQEVGGSMLDNSLIYWGNEYGENANGNPHTYANMTAMIAGGAAGKLQLGYYIDYRKNGSRPFSNLLVSFFNAMGLSSADYQRGGVVGFGEYNQNAINRFGMQNWVTNAERIKPLPFLYKGPILG